MRPWVEVRASIKSEAPILPIVGCRTTCGFGLPVCELGFLTTVLLEVGLWLTACLSVCSQTVCRTVSLSVSLLGSLSDWLFALWGLLWRPFPGGRIHLVYLRVDLACICRVGHAQSL